MSDINFEQDLIDELLKDFESRVKDISKEINAQKDEFKLTINGGDLSITFPDSYPDDLKQKIRDRM